MMIEYHPYQGTADVIAQLSVTTALDSDTVATLNATNAKLTLQLKTSQAYIQKLKEDILQLKLKIKSYWQGQRPAKMTDNNNYCWSHGYQVHNEHTSASCKNQNEGQKKETTKNNPMGEVKWVNNDVEGQQRF
jgi:predicted 2-oxoglutarate/Fe(II)-dependent dioxygenase YbiX